MIRRHSHSQSLQINVIWNCNEQFRNEKRIRQCLRAETASPILFVRCLISLCCSSCVSWCSTHGDIPYTECSAKESTNVHQAIMDLARRTMKQIHAERAAEQEASGHSIQRCAVHRDIASVFANFSLFASHLLQFRHSASQRRPHESSLAIECGR